MAYTIANNIAEVQEAAGEATTASTAFTSGNQLVALVYWDSATITVTSVQYDPGGANQTNLTVIGSTVAPAVANTKLAIYYLSNIPVTGSKTIRVTWSGAMGGAGAMRVFGLAGGNTTDALDAQNGTTGTSGNASVSVTTTTANCAMFVVVSSDGSKPDPDTDYTRIVTTNIGYYSEGEYNLDVGTAAPKTVQMAHSSSNWGIKAAAFKTSGAAGTTPRTFTGTDSLAGGELL